MIVYDGFADPRLRKTKRSVAIGIFDGVHRGHLKILGRMLAGARRAGARSMVVTFEPHPNKILQPLRKHPIIMSLQHRLRIFESLGVQETLVIRFNRRFSRKSREFFLHDLLLGRLGMKALTVGHDFRFGRAAEGDVRYLRREAAKGGYSLARIRPLKQKRHIISSTQIRRLIERGHFKSAGRMLGRPVSIYGTVVPGRGRGVRVGYPTANMDPHHETLPPGGVYAARGLLNGRRLKGVIHIGERPTFSDRERTVEVHFLNYHGNLYGRELELVFIQRLRSTRRFSGPKALAAAIRGDIRRALQILR